MTGSLLQNFVILLVGVHVNNPFTRGYELQFDLSLHQECNFSPEMWCSSVEIARRCQVEDACHKNVWSRTQAAAPPVGFSLYYETLCPDCQHFMRKQLWPAYKRIASIISLNLAPYGNAKEYKQGGTWLFECQHGKPECVGNTIQTCAIHLLRNASLYLPFVHCMEMSELLPEKSAPLCADSLSLDYSAISSCAYGSLGNRLQHDVAVETNALRPPHTFVPWVTLNGVHTDRIQEAAETNLVKLICDTYKGDKPAGCYDKQPPLPNRHCIRN